MKNVDIGIAESCGDFLQKHNNCALATGADDFVRCTPIEYSYVERKLWMFSEGGLKFRALEKNKNVSIAIYFQVNTTNYWNIRKFQ